jgi:hypothetical protein
MADWVPLTQGGALRGFQQNEVPEHQDAGEQAVDQLSNSA